MYSQDDDSIDKDGNELDGECARPQKHAKSPELAREFLLDAATVIFKEQACLDSNIIFCACPSLSVTDRVLSFRLKRLSEKEQHAKMHTAYSSVLH